MIFCLQTYKQTNTFLLTSLKKKEKYSYTSGMTIRVFTYSSFSQFFRGYTFCQFDILPIRLKTHILSANLLTKCKFLALLAKCVLGKMCRRASFSRLSLLHFYIPFSFPLFS
ncbi:unnamed protein product [Meloidogyne enterolobii]|uniref:Uncharacterized protein n=1 Tax=Meloidogyne enterolobii TaxID=390850 RepID=A0ACB1AKK8_MELEN